MARDGRRRGRVRDLRARSRVRANASGQGSVELAVHEAGVPEALAQVVRAMLDNRKKPWLECQLRTAQRRHFCDLCGEHIAAGESYRDAKDRGKAHEACAQMESGNEPA
jgi:hypothetical protein